MIMSKNKLTRDVNNSVVIKGGLFIPQYYYNYFTGY